MNVRAAIERGLTYSPLVAGTIYGAVVIAFVAMTWIALADLYTGQSELANTAALLERLQGRKTPTALDGVTMNGSPFLDGPSVTVAGAALLQRVAGAVTRVGGNILSSQVDVKEAQQKAGLISMVASLEVAQPDLQKLLYDLEAGMPYLFIDQLSVQAPDTVTRGEGGRLRVVLGVSGQWQGGK